jgi:hypothetical protein
MKTGGLSAYTHRHLVRARPVTHQIETQIKFRHRNDILYKFMDRGKSLRTGFVFYSCIIVHKLQLINALASYIYSV